MTVKKIDPKLEEEEEKEEEEEDENSATIPTKKKEKKQEEEMPTWAKQIIKLLTPNDQPPEAKIIPTPKAPPEKIKEEEDDLEKQNPNQEEKKPNQTFLGWFW